MFIKLIALYSYVVSINFLPKPYHGAALRPNVTSTLMSVDFNSVIESEGKWPPTIQTNTWMAVPTTLTPTKIQFTVPTLRQKSVLRNNLQNNIKQKYRQLYTNPLLYYNSTYNVPPNSGNNSKRHIKTLTSKSQLSTKSNSLSSLQSIKHNSLKSHVYPTNIKNNKETNNLSNEIATFNFQTQMPKYIKSQMKEYRKPLCRSVNKKKYSTSVQLNTPRLTNVKKKRNATNSLLSFKYWHYLQKSLLRAMQIIFVKPINGTNGTTATTNFHENMANKTEINKNIAIVKHSVDTIVAKSLNSFKTFTFERHGRRNSLKRVKTSPKSKTTNVAALTAKILEDIFSVSQFFRKILKPAKEFMENVRGILWSKKSKSDRDNSVRISKDYGLYLNSNEDQANDNNHRQVINTSSHTLNQDTAAIVEATIATSLERSFPVKLENSVFSLAAINKVKGSKGHVHKGNTNIKYILIKPPLTAASQRLSLRNLHEVHNKTLNVPFQASILSGKPSPQKTHTSSSLLIALTSNALLAVNAGREMKRVKKKLKKILIPLLLAYKLKFIVLIPLLIGGLILLVGATGLAGFFFALFIAVMSLKSGNGSAFIVEKN